MWPNGSVSVPIRSPQNWSSTGRVLGRAGVDRLLERGVDVLDIDHQADGGAAARLGPEMPHVGEFVGEHDEAVADLDLGMADLVAHRQPELLLRAERLLVEFDRRGRVVDDQIGRDAVIPFGNWLRPFSASLSESPAATPLSASIVTDAIQRLTDRLALAPIVANGPRMTVLDAPRITPEIVAEHGLSPTRNMTASSTRSAASRTWSSSASSR